MSVKKCDKWELVVGGAEDPLVELSAAENEAMNSAEEIWVPHCKRAEEFTADRIFRGWSSIENDAAFGDEEAMTKLERYGNKESWQKVQRVRGMALDRKFHEEHSEVFRRDLQPIAERLRAAVRAFVENYRQEVARFQRLVGVEDGLSAGDRVLAQCRYVEEMLTRVVEHPGDKFSPLPVLCPGLFRKKEGGAA